MPRRKKVNPEKRAAEIAKEVATFVADMEAVTAKASSQSKTISDALDVFRAAETEAAAATSAKREQLAADLAAAKQETFDTGGKVDRVPQILEQERALFEQETVAAAKRLAALNAASTVPT